jgi:hypothetical protein
VGCLVDVYLSWMENGECPALTGCDVLNKFC